MVRLRWLIVAGWVVVTVAATLLLPTIREAQVGALGDLVAHDARAIRAERESHERFAFPLLSRTVVVERNARGLSRRRQIRAVRLGVALNRHTLPVVDGIAGALLASNTLGKPPFSKESSTTSLFFLFFPPDIGQLGRTSLAEHFADRHLRPASPGTYVGVTGAIPARFVETSAIEDALPWIELATVLLVALAVGLHFRAVGAPLVNLLAVGVAYLLSIRVMAWIGKAVGISVPSEVQPVVVVLLFGVVTDYSIFFLTRFRRRLGEGADGPSAARQTVVELTPIIVAAGLTVAAGSAALAVAQLGFLQAFGPGMAMAVLVALAVALTFVPAALAIGGRRLFWPVSPSRSRNGGHRTLARRVVQAAVARPVATIAGCLVVLAACASGLFMLEVGNPLIRGLPSDSGPRRAYAQARRGFAAGILSPTVLIVARPAITRRPGSLRRLQRAIERQPGVAQVIGPAQNPTGTNFGGVLSKTGNAARYVVVFASDPLGATAIAHLRLLRKRMPGLLREAGVTDAEVSIAGDTALAEETISGARADLLRVLPVALAAVLLILALFLRSLIAPLYLVAAAALAPLAALGLAAFVFQGLLGQPELAYYVPVAATVLLIALGSDYNVFLAGRVWAEARRRDIREAVEIAGAGAAGAIAAAGLVLAASFALLALVPLRAFREISFVMASGLMIDAFLVRALLVPALIAMVGSRSGWPSHRLRRSSARAGARSAGGQAAGAESR